MKNSTQSTGSSKRRVRSQQTETIERNGKIVATIRRRRREVEFELGPEIKDIHGVFLRIKHLLMEAAEQYVDAKVNDQANDDL